MKFVCSSDWHLATKGPVTRKDDWVTTMFSKLDQLALIARKVKARGILCGGDIFTKESRVDWSLMHRLLNWCFTLKRDGIEIYTVPGNHDLRHDRYDSLYTQPIGILFATGAMIDVSFRHVLLTEPADGDEFRVSIHGLPYPAASSLDSFRDLQDSAATRRILIAHCFATPNGGEYYGEPMLSYKVLYTYPYDVFVFGHDHSDNGVVRLTGPTGRSSIFVNNGALSRGSISRENIERTIKCTIVSLLPDGVTAQEVKLNVRPVSEVFDLALKAQKEREDSHVEDFIDKLSDDLVDTGDLNFNERIDRMGLAAEVKARVLHYVAEGEKTANGVPS